MAEPTSLDELLPGKFEALLHPAVTRRRAAQQVPLRVATRLASPIEPATRAEWSARFIELYWPTLHAERGSRWDLGWDELVAGFVVAIELLAGELPRPLQASLEGTPAWPLWERWRRSYSRHVLLLDADVRICRVFVAPGSRSPGAPVEHAIRWRHDGPPLLGRSHTLLLGLMADRRLPEELGPLAGTGELDADGRTVRPVMGLVAKLKGWRARFPEGTLITGPLGELDDKDWAALSGTRYVSREEAEANARWITGGSMAEVVAKLAEPLPPITRWDGSLLDAESLAETRLQRSSGAPPFSALHSGNPLLEAAWAASRQPSGAEARRGLLIQGHPGAGKSILSFILEHQFRTGPLGALGFGVRRAARELAGDLRQSSSPTWSELLAVREPRRRELFQELERTGRLVPIVDGLDELGSTQLREVAALLRRSPGWWVATSRPISHAEAALPPAWGLELEQPSEEEARRLLKGAGRADLADMLYPRSLNAMRYSYASRLPDSLSELKRTPLHLTLLAKVTRPGERPDQIPPHELYRRVFQGLLDQACQDRRLSEREVEQLRALRANVLGELALSWLRSPRGYLDRTQVDLTLEDAEFPAAARPELLRALEFGHLLAPAGDAWEFAHRTLAEWMAAEALYRSVTHRLRQHERTTGVAATRADRARIELEALAPFLAEPVLPHQGPWAQLLLFYSPHLIEPLAFLEHILGPGARSRWQLPSETVLLDRTAPPPPPHRAASGPEVMRTWDFVFALLCQCVWEHSADACGAWAIAARRWLLFEYNDPSAAIGEKNVTRLQQLSRAVARHLPMHLPELLALVARTDAQRERLGADPTLLLPAIPSTHALALEPLLRGASRRHRLAVLEWHAEHGLDVDATLLDSWIQALPTEIAEARVAAAEELDSIPDEEMWRAPRPKAALVDALASLEKQVWETRLRTRRTLPWPLVRARLLEWPHHLVPVIQRWMGQRSEKLSPDEAEAEDQHRREVLAFSLHEAGTAERSLLGELKRLQQEPDGAEIVGKARDDLDDSEDRAAWDCKHLLEGLARQLGWELRKIWTLSNEAARDKSYELRNRVRHLHSLRRRSEALVQELDEARLRSVLGGLWELLPPDHPDREELLSAVEATKRPPPQLPASVLMARQSSYGWRLEQMAWAPHQLQEIRELARTARGELRLTALLLLAHLDKVDVTTVLLRALPTADEQLAAIIRERLEQRVSYADKGPADFVPPAELARLPLPMRADRDVPGWRAELLAQLATADDKLGPLCTLAEQHGVREALPLLAERLSTSQGLDASALVKTIAQLCTEADSRWARLALRHALRHGWPDERISRYPHLPEPEDRSPAGASLARVLTLEDLDLLAEGTVSALHHPSLAAAILRVGPEAPGRLLSRFQELTEQVNRLEQSKSPLKAALPLSVDREDGPLASARGKRAALAETLVASFDRSRQRLADAVTLGLQVAGGDVHRVYGLPGPLGKDFDEPGDLDWHSYQENAPLIEALCKHLEIRLSNEPEAWPELRRLFAHPSETLRKRAFELSADRAAPHQVAELALQSLEGHARANQTRWAGNTPGLLLSRFQSGMGSNSIQAPDTADTLVAAVRKCLTPAHRGVIEALVRHELPLFRALGAQWAAQLGNASWAELVVPLLSHHEAWVVRSALDAILSLAPESLDSALSHADRSAWTSLHDAAVLAGLKARPLSATTFQTLLAESAERLGKAPDVARRSATAFDEFPTLVEKLCGTRWKEKGPGPEEVAMLRRWSHHESVLIRAISWRLRALSGDLTSEELLPLLSGEPLERISAAECLVRIADEPHRSEASAIWETALGSWEKRKELGQHDLDEQELHKRLLWGLRGATPSFAPLLSLLVRKVPYDDMQASYTQHGEYLVAQTLGVIRRWGEPGFTALMELIEAGAIEDHYHFMNAVKGEAKRNETFREWLQQQAAAGNGTAQSVLEELREEQERQDLEGLAARLASEVFPSAGG